MEVREVYDELRKLLCNQDKALKELVWTIAKNQKLSRPRNTLLVGELGSGKTTIVQLTAAKMDIPLAEVFGFCTESGFNKNVLFDAFCKLFMENNREECKGIVLIHDMKDCFLYGGFSELESLITSAFFTYENNFFDLSQVMFVGEIDVNGYEDCFIPKPIYTFENIDDAILSLDYNGDEVKRIIQDLLMTDISTVDIEEGYDRKYREAIKRAFLSVECNKTFGKKIFMDNMKFEDIKKAIESPISELQIYSDDLCEEYIASPAFINSVAHHISESTVGLHDMEDAVLDTAISDNKRKVKVFKNNSLLKL